MTGPGSAEDLFGGLSLRWETPCVVGYGTIYGHVARTVGKDVKQWLLSLDGRGDA